ncbi:MAG TPA: helix-turn-helix transcriptional regulator [Leifsonia sp.]|jgi:transcriptional regulator with XRE-family HTH domain|nr:helix-turn-helix transcriptional regulator [Leifsonia sp.]
MAASTLLRSSRLASGITQGDLAVRAKTSQPEISTIESGKKIPTVDTLERLLRQTGHRIIAVPGSGADATETAERIASSSSNDSALRAFLDYSDGLARAAGVDRVVLGIAEPPSTGSAAWDAALAALVDYWLGKSRLPKPEWINSRSRFLVTPRSPQLGEYDLAPELADVPQEFRRRNVLVERATLESA